MSADDLIGSRIGTRTVLAMIPASVLNGTERLKLLCDCGDISIVTRRAARKTCPRCAAVEKNAVHRAAVEARYRALIGTRIGAREVLDVRPGGRGRYSLHLRCDDGHEVWVEARYAGRRCVHCGEHRDSPRQRTEPELVRLLAERRDAAPWIWRNTCTCAAGERCTLCDAQLEAVGELVALLGREMTHAEIGALLGFTRQRAEQIDTGARRHLARLASVRELAASVEERAGGSWSSWSAAGELAASGGAE